MSYKYEIFRRNSNNIWTFDHSFGSVNQNHTFDIAEEQWEGKEIMVKVYHSEASVDPLTGNCSNQAFSITGQLAGCVGFWSFDGETVFDAGELTLSTPFLYDVLDGVIFNNIFCRDLNRDPDDGRKHIIAQVNAHGEERYLMAIYRTSSPTAYIGTGWIEGKLPNTIDLLDDVWGVWSSNMDFWAATYRLRVVVSGPPCNSWLPKEVEFQVVPGTSGCRITNIREVEPEIVLYPNPTSDEIRLMGFEEGFDELDYSIFDLNGKLVKEGVLYDIDSSIQTFDLPNGMYIFHAIIDNEKIAKQFTVSKRP